MSDSLVGDALAFALGLAAGYYLHSRRRTSPAATDPTAPEAAMADSDQAKAEQQRLLDTIVIQCEHLGHMPSHIPSATVERASLSRDLRNLQRLGWGGDDHTNLCHYHNPGSRVGLDVLHVLCGIPGCGERATIPAGNANSGFGQLRNAGWTNVKGHREQRCLYCSGRPRPRW